MKIRIHSLEKENMKMKFNQWSTSRILAGKKTLTSRTEKHENDPDVLYIVGPLPWGFIKKYLYRDEGAESPEQLQRVINQIFRRVVTDDRLFYVHVIDTYSLTQKWALGEDEKQ